MTDHAIVIGIDTYANPDWALVAAARDAAKFAEWVVEKDAGRATRETLTLLLSPKDGTLPTALPYAPATRDNIYKAFERYMYGKLPSDIGRLWIFYSGHAVAPPLGIVDSAPVIVPADEGHRPIPQYLGDKPLTLGTYLEALRTRPTGTQFFFLDACRAPSASTSAFTIGTILTVNLADLVSTADQAVLYATTARDLALERGLNGLFSRALLEGLRGFGGLTPDIHQGDFVLTVNTLAAFVKARVIELSRIPGQPHASRPTQTPDPVCRGDLSEVALVRFAPDRRPRAVLDLFVKPSQARVLGQAAIRMLDPYTGSFVRIDPRSPVHDPEQWELPKGKHHLEVVAKGYAPWRQPVQLVGDLQLRVKLDAQAVPLNDHAPGRDPFAAGARGLLRVETPDVLARVEVFGPDGRRIDRRRSAVVLRNLPVGPYRVEVTLPGHPGSGHIAVVQEDRETRLASPPPGAVASLARILDKLGMEPENGLARPSTAFTDAAREEQAGGLGSDPGEPAIAIATTTATRVGSLLAWATASARFSADAVTARLQAVGVRCGGSGDVQVLIGDAWDGLIQLKQFVALGYGAPGAEAPIATVALAATEGLASQWQGPGQTAGSLLLHAPPLLSRIRLPLAAVPGYVSIVIASQEADRQIDLHRYLVPGVPPGDGEAFTDAIRVMEDGWRALQGGVPFLPGEAEDLLARDDLDPLALAVIGFRLHRERYLGPLGTVADESSPLARMLTAAPGLPDVHVLAALVAAGDEPLGLDGAPGAALRAAAHAGPPLIAAAHDVLAPWLPALQVDDAVSRPPPMIAGRAWTVFAAGPEESTMENKDTQVNS